MADELTAAEGPPCSVSIVLPTFNERDNIARLIETLGRLVPDLLEVIVVDDNSPDGTASVVEELMRHRRDVKIIVREAERGLTSAIQAGIDASRGDVVVWMDADFSLPPETVPELVDCVVSRGYDAAIGSRFVPGGADSPWDELGPLVVLQKVCTATLNGVTRLAMGAPMHDWTSGFIAVRGPLIRRIRLRGGYGEYFIFLMARLLEMRVRWIEVPYKNVARVFGESKTAESVLGLLGRGFRYTTAVFVAASRLRLGRPRPD